MNKDEFGKHMDDEAKRVLDDLIKRSAKEHFRHEFSKFDCSTLPKMSDKELAEWQAKHPTDSPQYVIALQEWSRRATARQTKWMKFSAILASITAIIGVFIGAALQEYRESKKKPQPIEVICKTPDAPTAPNPKEITTQKKTDSQPTKKIIRRQPDGETK